MSAMTALALPADEWTAATVGSSVEVTIGALGPVGILVFVGAAEPLGTSFVGKSIDTNCDAKLPIEDGDEVWIRPRVPGIAAQAFVWPHAAST